MLDREKTILAINNIMEKNEIKIQELLFLNKINLRLNPNNNNHMSICEKILGLLRILHNRGDIAL